MPFFTLRRSHQKRAGQHVTKRGLQKAVIKRKINADARLKPAFGKAQAAMFEMTKPLDACLK
ncbi:MAG: SWIB/MDM2 domain-containing protein [Acidiferrobacterales bacterium]